MPRGKKWPVLVSVFGCMAALGCPSPEQGESGTPPAGSASEITGLIEALTLHASFDEGIDADFALGDAILYTASSWDQLEEARAGLGNSDVERLEDLGRVGGALRFNSRNTSAIFYRAEHKVAYSENDWSGTVSFWLNLNPGEDLEPGYCDPIQITDQAYNDAAVWVDFTAANPRQFRLGVFGDLEAWNPEGLSADEHPGFQNRLVVVDDPPFRGGEWTHVVVTYSGLNSASGGVGKLYLDGHLQGTIQNILEPFTWDLTRAQLRIGVNYVGLFDELAMFDRALTDAEVLTIRQLEGGVAALHPVAP